MSQYSSGSISGGSRSQSGSLPSSADYAEFKSFLEKACGILLGDNKQYLVSSRLSKLMQDNAISSLSELVKEMQMISKRNLKQAVIDAMTTNETLWFRDAHPFDILQRKLLPELQQQSRSREIRIWSAACSSGQEPYSLSMTVEEFKSTSMGLMKYPVEIVATELSASMLDCCKRAEYNELALKRGLSPERLKRFFTQVNDDVWKVKPEIGQRIRFQSLNLMDNYFSLGKFDIIFCRNVLIYFSAELKSDILRRMHSALNPGGYLVLGASEGLTDAGQLYEMVQCNPGIIYRAL